MCMKTTKTILFVQYLQVHKNNQLPTITLIFLSRAAPRWVCQNLVISRTSQICVNQICLPHKHIFRWIISSKFSQDCHCSLLTITVIVKWQLTIPYKSENNFVKILLYDIMWLHVHTHDTLVLYIIHFF